MFTLKSTTWGLAFLFGFIAKPLFVLAVVSIAIFAFVMPVHAMSYVTPADGLPAAYLVNDTPYYGNVLASDGINSIQTDTVAPLPYTPQIVNLPAKGSIEFVAVRKGGKSDTESIDTAVAPKDTSVVVVTDEKPADSVDTKQEEPKEDNEKVHPNNGSGNGAELDSNGNDLDPNSNPHANDND